MTNMKFGIDREAMVEEFHRAFGHPVDAEWKDNLLILRATLVDEEASELNDAIFDVINNPYEGCEEALLKEMADLQYVLSGMAVALGLDLEEATRRVHESNMSKLGEDGKPTYRADGKVLKGPNYKEPDLSDLVQMKDKKEGEAA